MRATAQAECRLQLRELVPLPLLRVESLAQPYQLTYSLPGQGVLGATPLELPAELLVAHPVVRDGLLCSALPTYWLLVELLGQLVDGLGDLGKVGGGTCKVTQRGEV